MYDSKACHKFLCFKCCNPLKTVYREKQEIHTTRNRISCAQITKEGYGRNYA